MSYTLLSVKTRTARKPHRCVWCGEAINAGEKYIDHRYIGEDGPTTDRFHDECDVAMVNSDIGDDGFALYQQERGLTREELSKAGPRGPEGLNNENIPD